jgi:hypothetical protein
VVFALLYADNSDIVGTYTSREAALADLASFVEKHPEMQDDIGLRPYEDGRPAGEFHSATELLSGRLAQAPLDVASASRGS